MRSTRLSASILLLTLLATPAAAQVCKEAQAVTAPCEGVLLPSQWALEAVQCKKVWVPLCQAEKDQLGAQLRIARFDLDQARLEARRGWYEHPALWAVVGALGASALFLGVAR